MVRKKLAFIFGTRPEAVKLCPLVLAMEDHPRFQSEVCVTGQHRRMLDQVLNTFSVAPDVDLDLMRCGQSLGAFTSRAMAACDRYLAESRPDMVIVQGDTTTVFCAALAAFYHRIPVGHVEAGLRTWNKRSPFPEEIHRVMTTRLSDCHFAPTPQAKKNLLEEDVPEERIFVTGNTVVDALLFAVERTRRKRPEITGLPRGFLALGAGRRLVLITGHRRESFGPGFEAIGKAVSLLARRFSGVDFVYPVHLNPNVREPVHRLLAGRSNVHLIEPLGYLPFVALMDRADVILTDSGGIQEEASSLGRPVLVMRDTTERPEAVEAGAAKLVGTDAEMIVDHVSTLLTRPAARRGMAGPIHLYGDGQACRRIIAALEQVLFPHEAPWAAKASNRPPRAPGARVSSAARPGSTWKSALTATSGQPDVLG